MLTYSKNFGLPICFIVLVTEPPVREQLPDIGNVFFLEVAYGLFGGGERVHNLTVMLSFTRYSA